jgi:hypothetical protein
MKSFSSIVTPVAATVAALVSIWVKLDNAHHQTVVHHFQEKQLEFNTDLNEKAKNIAVQTGTIETSLKSMEVRERTESASYKFAEEFLTYIRDNQQRFAKCPQIGVAALSIIAEASSDSSGNSDPLSRKAMPVKMALLLNDPGSVATTDPSLELIPKWWDTAFWAEDDSIQATAIKALCAICRAAIRDFSDRIRSQGYAEQQLNTKLPTQCVDAIDLLRRRLLEKQTGFVDRIANLSGDGEAAAVRIRLEALREVSRIYSDVKSDMSHSDVIDRSWKGNPGLAKILNQLAEADGDFQQLRTETESNKSAENTSAAQHK